jgi:uncharacterized protein DUF1302
MMPSPGSRPTIGLVVCGLVLLGSQVAAAPPRLTGFFDNRTAYRVTGKRGLSELQNRFQLEIEKTWGNWDVRATGRAVDESELEPQRRRDFDLRELVLERRGPSYDLRLGRQQVVWGKTDGLRLLDVVNPLDLREFVLDRYVDLRIPLWMGQAELFHGDQSFQFLVIPDVRFDRIPASGGEFFPAPVPSPALTVGVRRRSEPADIPENWKYGFRWSFPAGSWDLSVNALYGWSNQPVLSAFLGPGPTLELVETPKRGRILGFTGETPAGPVVLRFEAGLTPDGLPEVVPPGAVLGRRDLLRTAVGVDWIHRSWLLSPQIFVEISRERRPKTASGRDRSFLTTLVQRKFLQDRLGLRAFYAYSLVDGDHWISPQVSFQVGGRLELTLGSDLFGGSAEGELGRFRTRDRLFLSTLVRF